MAAGGKGDAPRPKSVSEDEYADRWDAIFGKKPAKPGTEQDDARAEQVP